MPHRATALVVPGIVALSASCPPAEGAPAPVAVPVAARSAAVQGPPEKWRSLRVKPVAVDDVAALPAEALLRLFVDASPAPAGTNQASLGALVAGRVRAGKPGCIDVDVEGLGERWRECKGAGPHVVDWFAGGRFCHLVFFERGRQWWVASANELEAKSADLVVRLLDGDADGSFWDPNDFVAFQGGGLRAIAGIDRVDDGSLRGRIRLAGRSGSVSLQFLPAERPDGLNEDQWLAYRTANAMRNRHGLPPALVWREANDGLLAHTRFLHLHAPDKQGALTTYYGEAEGLPGRTDLGDEMSRGGCVVFLPEGGTVADHVASCLAMTQSRRDVFARGAARFGAGRTERWSFFRGQEGPSQGTRCLVLPGAGTTDLPRACGSNWPFPRSFPDLYARPRGLPVSVVLPNAPLSDGSTLRVRSIALFTLPELREVPGFFFSIRDIEPGAPEDTFFFVPGEPLDAEASYLAQAAIEATRRAEGAAGITSDAELLQWQFRTGR